MNKVAIVQYARLASKRVPNKLIHQFSDGSTLLGRGIKILKDIEQRYAAVGIIVSPYIACSFEDQVLIDAAYDASIPIINLTTLEADTEDFTSLTVPLISTLTNDNITYALLSNFLCHPLVSIAVQTKIINACLEATTPLVTTVKKRGSIWDDKETCIYSPNQLPNTKLNPEYQEFAHLGYALPVSMIGTVEYQLMNKSKPLPLDLTWADRIDIDTMDDVNHLNAVLSPTSTQEGTPN